MSYGVINCNDLKVTSLLVLENGIPNYQCSNEYYKRKIIRKIKS